MEDNNTEPNSSIKNNIDKIKTPKDPKIDARIKDILEWVYCIVIAVVIAILIKYYIGIPTSVRMSSMYPTLKEGDRLILNRLTRTFDKKPERGDIITFEAPTDLNETDKNLDLNNPIAIYDNQPQTWWDKFTYYVLEIGKTSYIKRVIAFEGEHVTIKDGRVYIDDKPLDEPYLGSDVKTGSNLLTDFTVPKGCIFAMGDNRADSKDCRELGCIPLEKIESKVWIRFFPFNKFGKIQ